MTRETARTLFWVTWIFHVVFLLRGAPPVLMLVTIPVMALMLGYQMGHTRGMRDMGALTLDAVEEALEEVKRKRQSTETTTPPEAS